MPRKQQKPREQRIAEEFFPVEPQDIKYAVEKINKPMSVELQEKIISPETDVKVKKKASKKKVLKSGIKKKAVKGKSFSSKTVEFSPQKVTLKQDGYELIVTEKPQAALKIASALGKATKRGDKGVPYYELTRKETGKKIVVACAVGHLFALTQKSRGAPLPVFDLMWVPNYMTRKKDFSKRYYDNLVKLVKGASSITVATDYDVEGEVIGMNIVRFIAAQKDASRMKFSTLTEKELNEAYENKSSSINWGQAIAGETRHNLDWIYGINLSRFLMNAIKSTGSFRIFSVGRVQGPTLHLIVEKEREISAFKPTKYWQAMINIEGLEPELVHNKDIFEKKDLDSFENLKGKTASVSTTKTQETLQPNPPFNLTSLQTEAYKLFGMNPSRTLATAQSLYLAGLISYPRTSSQKLPPSIGYEEILKTLSKRYGVESLISREAPLEGKKTDPAHPSIYPTGVFQELDSDEKKLYDLIVKRFLCLFIEDALIENKTVTADVDGLKFFIGGMEIKKDSWLSVYPSRVKEKSLKDVEGKKKVTNSRTEEKETQPPRRFSPASILSELEKRNLGTKATRTSMLETLYDRGYIQDQSIRATPLGVSMIETLERHSPVIIDEALTREFEKDMDEIVESSSGFQEKENKIIERAKKTITDISKKFSKEEKEIGQELSQATSKLWIQQKQENTLNQCPVCKNGNLSIIYSRKTGRYFVACSAYPECKNTYSLPPNGLIKKTEKACESCGFPILMRISKGKRPWEFCFNKDCEKNKERLEEYRKKKEGEADQAKEKDV